MKRWLDAVLVLALLSALVWCSRELISWRSAAARATVELGLLSSTEAAAADLVAWRARPALVSESHTPSQLLLAMVSEAGNSAGIAAAAIKSVEGERDRPVAGGSGAFKQQSLRIQFEAVQLPEFGRFLNHWRNENPTWSPTKIELSPAAAARVDSPVKWNCWAVFENVYLAR